MYYLDCRMLQGSGISTYLMGLIRIYKKNTLIGTKNVINTNYCDISICETNDSNRLVILSAKDNLIKGGAGQAIQNLNIKFGFKIDEGLI